MNRRGFLAVAAVLVAGMVLVAAVAVGLVIVAPTVLADRTSHYDYEFTVETNATMTDVQLYLPVPVGPEGPATGRVVVRGDDGQAVPNSTAVVRTEHGPMLSVEVDRLSGSLSYLLLTFDDDGNLTDRRVVDPDELPADMSNKRATPISTRYSIQVFYEPRDGGEPIETRHPVGNESTLSPRYDAEAVDCVSGYTDETDACYEFETMVFASYETDPGNVVHVSGEYAGWNEWGWGLSNSYNVFTERVERTALVGPQDGWKVTRAHVHTGEGSYPTRGN